MEDINKLKSEFVEWEVELTKGVANSKVSAKSIADWWIEKYATLNQKREEEIKNAVDEIHTELHNGRMEPAYKLTCNLLALLKGEETK